jgi:diacylglycerol kinase family enzyme
MLTPRASVTDGLLDVCLVEPRARTDFARLALKFRSGEHVEAEGVRYLQVPWLRVTADRALTVNADGESRETETLEYRARAGDLLVHVKKIPGT